MDSSTRWDDLDTDLTRDARDEMVARQIEGRGVADTRVLDAMRALPRHFFVPPAKANRAYDDCPLEIGCGQTISQPYMVAMMTELLDVHRTARVLEVGIGSGYQTAILAMLAEHVYSLELLGSLLETAETRLAQLGLTNVTLACDDGSEGWFEHAPYDRIIVAAAPPEVPALLPKQLADGGHLVIPVGERRLQTLVKVTRHGDHFDRSEHGGCLFVPLHGSGGWHENTN